MAVPSDWSQKLQTFVDKEKKNPIPYEYLGDGRFPKFFLTEQAMSWDGFLNWLNELNGSWCYRGQREADWFLNTSLDRAVKREHSSANSSGYYISTEKLKDVTCSSGSSNKPILTFTILRRART
jgi:hypothetical protein